MKELELVSSSKSKEKRHEFWKRFKPFILVVLMQFGFAGMDIISKNALNHGMSNYVFVVYRHAVAFIVIAPFALIFDRKTRPKMTIPIFFKILILSLLEPVIDQNLYFMGLKYTTATFAAAMGNVLPAITFLMAWLCRLEVVKLKSTHSQAKLAGTVATVGGAIIMTLVRGPIIDLPWTRGSIEHKNHGSGPDLKHCIMGAIMITIATTSWACFFIVQTFTLRIYPTELSLTALICLFGTLESAIVALVMERGNYGVWSIKWDSKLPSYLYSGIICSGATYYLQAVVTKDKGPVFVTAFLPLCMVLVAIMSSFILAEQMLLGRLLGAIIIVGGLYLVVWGKSKDYGSAIIDEEATSAKQTINEDENMKESIDRNVNTSIIDGVIVTKDEAL